MRSMRREGASARTEDVDIGVGRVLEGGGFPMDARFVEIVTNDELDPTDRARLHGFLADSIRKHVPGKGVSADEVLARVRARD